jgi:hypothetical protein
MTEESILLSKLERTMILAPEELTARQRKNLSYRLKARGSQLKQIFQELELLINSIPEDSIKENLSNTALISLMNTLERLLQIRNPWPIGVSEDGNGVMAFKLFGNSIPKNPERVPGKCAIDSISRTPMKGELELDYRLTNHFNAIRCFVDPCVPDPVCRDPEYFGRVAEDAFKTLKESGNPYHISENAYTDETGISNKGWILRKPSMVDIDQLKWMRWKPQGLKECIEEPPLFKSRKLPLKWGKGVSIGSNSTPDELEAFTESIKEANEKSEIPPKELEELNERLNRKMEELAEKEGACLSSRHEKP